ncbi:glycosyl transferase [Polaribacter pacificus]|uniref:Glycosyl transferase n=1 Tax=Polaribacter pacificus TaxID=1775173 RepID=A0A917MEM8_9FLAO|nr:glycosyltransferase [Polaribacter pacificus]GGG93718.1 glycosyl transferase [Polaribacter pacificus]
MVKKIIVAPLNWGLGHASRCVPIIHFLIQNKYLPVLASDGAALDLLKKEFPELPFLELPTYQIRYKKNLKWSLFLKGPKIWRAVKAEHKVVSNYIEEHPEVVGLISDNRFGVKSPNIPSVYLTHQVQVLAGIATFFTSFIHQKIIAGFDQCWVPDTVDSSFSGKLSHFKNSNIQVKYIGVLSRFKKRSVVQTIDVLILLSGVEPNRTLLESRLKKLFQGYPGKVVMVLGKIEAEQKTFQENGIEIVNFLLTKDLEDKLLQTKTVVCRSGYSSVMDLAILEKKAFFIPTKHQSEQEYLAYFLKSSERAPFQTEETFTIESLDELINYKGLKASETKLDKELLSLF